MSALVPVSTDPASQDTVRELQQKVADLTQQLQTRVEEPLDGASPGSGSNTASVAIPQKHLLGLKDKLHLSFHLQKHRPLPRPKLRQCTPRRTGLPFYVPKTTLVFAKNPKVFELLYTHKKALRHWASDQRPECMCHEMQQLFGVEPKFDGHAPSLDKKPPKHSMALLHRCCLAAPTVQFSLVVRKLSKHLKKGCEDGVSDIISVRMLPASHGCFNICGNIMNSLKQTDLTMEKSARSTKELKGWSGIAKIITPIVL